MLGGFNAIGSNNAGQVVERGANQDPSDEGSVHSQDNISASGISVAETEAPKYLTPHADQQDVNFQKIGWVVINPFFIQSSGTPIKVS